MRLTLEDDPIELESTHAVAVGGDALSSLNGADYVRVEYNGVCCGALVRPGGSGCADIGMDKFLRNFLHARVGDAVEIEPANFPSARQVTVLVPENTQQAGMELLVRDMLVSKPVCAGLHIPVFVTALTGEDCESSCAWAVVMICPVNVSVTSIISGFRPIKKPPSAARIATTVINNTRYFFSIIVLLCTSCVSLDLLGSSSFHTHSATGTDTVHHDSFFD